MSKPLTHQASRIGGFSVDGINPPFTKYDWEVCTMAKKETRFSVENMGTQDAIMANIITDKETGVQYLLAVYPSLGSGLTPLLDAEGKPLIKE